MQEHLERICTKLRSVTAVRFTIEEIEQDRIPQVRYFTDLHLTIAEIPKIIFPRSLANASTDDGLALMIAHEIAHVEFNHGEDIKRILKIQGAHPLKIILVLLIYKLLVKMKIPRREIYSKIHELEYKADERGVEIAYRAGFNVLKGIFFLSTILGSKPDQPDTTSRINRMYDKLEKLGK